MTAPAPASSLVWNLEFFEHEFGFGPDEWWRIDTDIDAASEGYVNQTGLLQDPKGQPVALSRQVFAIFGCLPAGDATLSPPIMRVDA